ncbi:putative reverse transcriptase domain-containing protein [Tanacetum coccineum]|uniref:Reverse transcriptase domain-containing protein n=1 Tax=Tanacetum coccineum TaxID=301880 RepID=A0ABQ5DVR6_9ASTR
MLAQQPEIRELQLADRRRQTVITEILAADHRRQEQLAKALKLEKRLQTQMAELQRQQGPANGLAQPELQEEAGVTAVLAARDANTNGIDNHNSGTCARRNERATRKTVGNDIAYAMTWTELKKKMTDKYCPRTEIKKLEVELQRTRESKIITINHNNNTKTRGRTPAGLMLQGLLRRNNTGDLNPYAQNATITMMVHVLLNATNAKKLAILLVTIEGHFKRECPKLKNNNNRGNQVRGGNAPAKVYAVRNAGINPDSNVVMGTLLLNNRHASVLFDTGASVLLDHYYDVELANERIIGSNTILRGCILNILNHPFNIDLMPIKVGSFDAIIGMDWLVKYQAIIVCAEKIVRIPWGNESLIVHGDRSNQGYEDRLHIISYTKTQEYMLKGYPVFLANVNTKETEDKSEKKRLEDVPIIRDFPDVFPEDLPGLPPTRQVEFQINLILGVVPVARAPYRLAPSKMKELSKQLKELSNKGFIRHSSSS